LFIYFIQLFFFQENFLNIVRFHDDLLLVPYKTY
jgi:hypothetical protein